MNRRLTASQRVASRLRIHPLSVFLFGTSYCLSRRRCCRDAEENGPAELTKTEHAAAATEICGSGPDVERPVQRDLCPASGSKLSSGGVPEGQAASTLY